MDCPKCGASNAPLKKSCYRCGTILSGYTMNNVTGEYGYRNPDGTFTAGNLKVDDNGQVDFNELKAFMPIGYLRHEPTGLSLTVYKPISRFKRIMLRWCFGLKFEKI